MKVEFITGEHKFEPAGPDKWRIVEPFVARVVCDEWPEPILIVVPGGYETDFESVPRILFFAYKLIKGKARRSATLHDYVIDLTQGEVSERLRTSLIPFVPPREWIDRLFYFAMKTEGTPAIARELAYAGVSAYTAIKGGR
jgi:hypothetical protein